MLPGGILVRLTGLHGRHSERQHAIHQREGQADDGEQHDQAAAAPSLPLVIVIIVISCRHRSGRIGASSNVQQQFVFLILVHFLPRRITSQPSKKEARSLTTGEVGLPPYP